MIHFFVNYKFHVFPKTKIRYKFKLSMQKIIRSPHHPRLSVTHTFTTFLRHCVTVPSSTGVPPLTVPSLAHRSFCTVGVAHHCQIQFVISNSLFWVQFVIPIFVGSVCTQSVLNACLQSLTVRSASLVSPATIKVQFVIPNSLLWVQFVIPIFLGSIFT